MADLDKQRVAINFGRAAKNYDKFAVLQKTVGERLIERLDLVRITPKVILDLGAGTGTTARALSGLYKSTEILQLDLSLPMLFLSRSRSARWFSKQRYLCADAEKLPVASSRIDLVFSSLTFQWCNDLDATFRETKRVLAPGGLFLFATLGPDTLRELRTSWATVDDVSHVNTFFDMHDIGDALVRTGMTGVVMDTENITLTYQDCYALMRDLKNVGAINASKARPKGLTGKQKMQGMINAYEEYRSEEGLPVTYEIVYGHAWYPENERQSGGLAYVPVENIRKRNR